MPAGTPTPFIHENVAYDFDHLEPVTALLHLAQGNTIPAEIRFKSHCYTRALEPGETPTGLLQYNDEEGNERYFCPVRHGLSLSLFDWICGWRYQPCIYGRNYRHGVENFIVVETSEGVPVKVAFSIDKHEHMPLGLLIWIKTTHPYDRSRPVIANRTNSVPFNTLAKQVAYTGSRPRAQKRR